MKGRDAAQPDDTQIQRVSRSARQQWNRLVAHVGDHPKVVQEIKLACLCGYVRGGIVLPQERRCFRLTLFGDNLAMTVRMKAIGHHTVIAGEVLDLGRSYLAQGCDGGGGLQFFQGVVDSAEELAHRHRIRHIRRLEFDGEQTVVSVPRELVGVSSQDAKAWARARTIADSPAQSGAFRPVRSQ